MNRRESLAALAALAAMPAAGAGPALVLASDLRADGEAARASRVPIVVLFSLPGCPYCEEIRRSHLVPMTKDPRRAGRALVRQVDVNSDRAVVGFRGEATTHARDVAVDPQQAHGRGQRDPGRGETATHHRPPREPPNSPSQPRRHDRTSG